MTDQRDRGHGAAVATALTDTEFDELYRAEYRAVVRLARLLTGNVAVAEDLAQEAFVRFYRSPAAARRPAALLTTIVVNVCRSWHTSRQRADQRLVRHGPDPTSTLSQFDRELDDSLRRLPHDQRAVIVLRYWLGWNERAIAAALGCRLGTVKSRHSRALIALRKELS